MACVLMLVKDFLISVIVMIIFHPLRRSCYACVDSGVR